MRALDLTDGNEHSLPQDEENNVPTLTNMATANAPIVVGAGLMAIGYSDENEVTDIWHFPDLDLPTADEIISSHHLRDNARSCPNGEHHEPSMWSWSSTPNTSGPGGSDTHNGVLGHLPSGNEDDQHEDGQGGDVPAQKNLKGAEPGNVWLACPFAKRDRDRYVSVDGTCTQRPGMPEIKRVK